MQSIPDSGIRELFTFGTQNPGTFCFWNRESRALESVIPLTIGIHDLSSTDKKSGYQYLQSGIHAIQDCHGLTSIWWYHVSYKFWSSLVINVYGVLKLRIFVSVLLVFLSLLLNDDPAKGYSIIFSFLYSKRVVLSIHPNFKECSKT